MAVSRLLLSVLSLSLSVSGYKTERDSGYGAPEPSYGAPSSGYEEPVSEYGGYEATAGGAPDITPILIGILVITGLALLFPSYVTLTDIRRKRSVPGAGVHDEGPDSNLVERVQSIYMAVLESEECVERVVCELGGLAEDAGFSKKMTKSLEMFAPKKYAKMMKTFNHGKDCKKNNKCGYF